MSSPTLLQSSPYTDRIIGFAGPTPLEITIDESGKISQVKLLPNKETPAYQQIAIDAGLPDAWNGLTPKEALGKQVDAVSGATFSSRGIIQTMHKRLEIYEAEQKSSQQLTLNFLVAGLGILILAGYLLFRRKKQRSFA